VVPPLGYRETDAAVSTVHCVYSSTKLAFDEHLLTPPPHLRITILRIANVVGGPAPLFPDQPPKFAQWLFTELLLASPDKLHTPVRLWKDEVRSFLFVEDLVRVLWRLVRTPGDQLQATARVLNIGV
jgi:nucleoside-diphosphate-sugar epimerase